MTRDKHTAPGHADELATFADLSGTPAVDLTGTRVDTDDAVTTTPLNLAPALPKEFDMPARIHDVLSALMAASEPERLLERPARTGPPTYALPTPRTLAGAIREVVAGQERQRLGLRDASLPEVADLCAEQGVPVFALTLPDELSGLFLAHVSVGRAIVANLAHHAVDRRLVIAHGLRACRVRPDGDDPCVHKRQRQGTDRTPRGGVCGRLPSARLRRCRNRTPSREGPAQSSGVLGLRCGD